jgi:lysozyme
MRILRFVSSLARSPAFPHRIPSAPSRWPLWLGSALLLTRALAAPLVYSGPLPEGVDVSSENGPIDWNQVAAAGRTFAFVRVSDGLTTIDSAFATNYAGAQAAGMIRGAYQYFEPNQDPVAQADLLLAQIGPLSAGDLAPVLDVEVTDGLSPSAVASRIHTWVSTIEQATGEAPIIYTGPGFWNNSVQSAGFSSDPLWIANWGVSLPLSVPSGWSDWEFWQYSDQGHLPGIGGAEGLDRFNGSAADLEALAHVSNQPVPDAADSLALMAFPLAGLAGLRWRRRRASSPS